VLLNNCIYKQDILISPVLDGLFNRNLKTVV